MPRLSLSFGALLLALLCLPALGAAPESRRDWLREEIEAHNRAFAAQAPDELATKMEKMSRSPYFFLRGTAHLFHRDMGRVGPAAALEQTVRLNGDAHLGNFGCYVDADGVAVFGLDDFDEADTGPAAWDLRRLATSIVLVGRDNKLDDAGIAAAVEEMTKGYLSRLSVFAAGESPRRFRISRDNAEGKVRDCIQSADRQRREKWLEGFSRARDGSRTFRDDRQLRIPPAQRRADLTAAVADYARSLGRATPFFAVKDVAQRLGSGVGSLGRLRYWVLVEGATPGPEDDVLLEIRQAAPSALRESHAARIGALDDARRIVSTVRQNTVAPDPLLGVLNLDGMHFVVRERPPRQADLNGDALDTPKRLQEVAGYAGAALAHAHAMQTPTTVLAEMARTRAAAGAADLRVFAFGYAAQVQQDWRDFRALLPELRY